MKILFKKKYIVIVLFFYSISFITQATIQKPYLPYPEVWGYDLSEFPAVKWGQSGVTAYAMDDGDIWFVIDYSYKKTNPKDYYSPTTDDKYVLIKFFKGEQTILSAQERKKYFKITEGKEIFFGYPHQKDITFSDNSKLRVYSGGMTKRCLVPDFWRDYFVKTDPQGKEKKYSILGASSQVSVWKSDIDCVARGTSPFFYQKLHNLTEIIPLKDDTFIVFSISKSNVILRFDKNFKTKFKSVTPVITDGNKIGRNYFVVDYEFIEKLYARFAGCDQAYQNIHDALLTHFEEQYPYK